jgi:hypothetical protein
MESSTETTTAGKETAHEQSESYVRAPIQTWFVHKLKSSTMADWIMVILTCCIATATILYTMYARNQWTVMSGQLAAMNNQIIEMKEAGKQTDRLIEEASAQAKATNTLAEQAKAQTDKMAESLKKTDKLIGATNKLAAEAKRQADASIRQFQATERPWVSIDDITSKPLQFVNATAMLIFRYNLRNTGRSPAIAVDVRSKLTPINLAIYSSDGLAKLLTDYCEPFSKQQDQAAKFPIFPGDKIPGVQTPGLSPREVQAGLKSSDNDNYGVMSFKGRIPVALLVCVDYQFSFSPGHHQSRYAYQVAVPISPGEGIYVGFDGRGFVPEGTYPDARLLNMGQTAD